MSTIKKTEKNKKERIATTMKIEGGNGGERKMEGTEKKKKKKKEKKTR